MTYILFPLLQDHKLKLEISDSKLKDIAVMESSTIKALKVQLAEKESLITEKEREIMRVSIVGFYLQVFFIFGLVKKKKQEPSPFLLARSLLGDLNLASLFFFV